MINYDERLKCCFFLRNKQEEPPVENPWSNSINGGYLTGLNDSSQERSVSDVYNSIDELHFTEYEEPPVPIPCSTFINGGYLTGLDDSSQGRSVSDVYNSIDEMHFTEHEEETKDTHF